MLPSGPLKKKYGTYVNVGLICTSAWLLCRIRHISSLPCASSFDTIFKCLTCGQAILPNLHPRLRLCYFRNINVHPLWPSSFSFFFLSSLHHLQGRPRTSRTLVAWFFKVLIRNLQIFDNALLESISLSDISTVPALSSFLDPRQHRRQIFTPSKSRKAAPSPLL